MAVLARQRVSMAGIAPALIAASAGGDEFANDGRTMAQVQNTGGAQITVTANSQRKCNQGFDHDVAVDVPAGEVREFGPFETGRFNDENGRVQITYSSVVGVNVGAFGI